MASRMAKEGQGTHHPHKALTQEATLSLHKVITKPNQHSGACFPAVEFFEGMTVQT